MAAAREESAVASEEPTFAFPDYVIAESKRIRESADYSRLVTNKEGRYSTILPFFTTQAVQIFRKHFPTITRVYDATANIGGDSINIAFNFPGAKVTAVEVDSDNAEILRRNVAAVGLEEQITCVEANCLTDIEKFSEAKPYDFVYFDPPWGGPDVWKKKKHLMLKLKSSVDVADLLPAELRPTELTTEEIPIYETVGRVFALGVSRAVVLKAPPNFDLGALEEALRAENHECTVTTELVRKRRRGRARGEVAYHMYVIQLENAAAGAGAAAADAAADAAAGAADAGAGAAGAAAAGAAAAGAGASTTGTFAALGRWAASASRRDREGADFVFRRLRMFLKKRLKATPQKLSQVLAFIERCARERMDDGKTLAQLAQMCEPFRSTQQEGRASARIADVAPVLQDLLTDDFVIENYLDIGCAEGGLTVAFGEALGLDASHTFGCDVVPVATDAKFEFATAQAEKLPYEDGQFQAISFIMSLHHIKDTPAALAEAQRVLAPGGLLIVREHDSRSKYFALFLDLVHYLYATVLGDEVELREGHESGDFEARRGWLSSSYKSQATWTKVIEGGKFDFVCAASPMVGGARGSDMFSSYYAFFRK